MTDWADIISSARVGVTMFPLADGRWQVSTRNDDGSFRVHFGNTLAEGLEKAFPDNDESWRDLI